MTAITIILILLLLAVVIVQIGKVSELSSKIRGEEEMEYASNKTQSWWLLGFMIAFLVLTVGSAWYYRNYMLGYGPHESASAHGGMLDGLFNLTLVFTGIVFVLTHIALFWFAYKYRGKKERRGTFISHNNTLEAVWSFIPALVMTLLVVKGLVAWNEVMADVEEGEEHTEIEATGYQFAWQLRYPGADGALGTRNFRMIDGTNPLGQDWTDDKNLDDILPDELVLPVNKKVRVRITSRDVLHNFYLPHFRVKMDAVPGIPTYFIFTPTKTTEEYREELSKYEEYNIPKYPAEPDGPLYWEEFNYELACAELCGKSHYSMRRTVRIVSQPEYDKWLSEQSSYYKSSIRNTAKDPRIGEVLDYEVKERREALNTDLESALAAPDSAGAKIIRLNYVEFQTGSSVLTENSRYELDNLAAALRKYQNIRIELGGHTDNTGDPVANQTLSQARADIVKTALQDRGIQANRMTSVGYGQTRPADTNDTDAGRQNNRRTEIKITAQ